MNYSYPHPLPPRIFPHIDAYILTLLQTNESTNIEPMHPPIPHVSPGNYIANHTNEPTVGLGRADIPYGTEPVVSPMQAYTADFFHAPPHGLSRINIQEGVGREWTYGTGSATTFSFPPRREVRQNSASCWCLACSPLTYDSVNTPSTPILVGSSFTKLPQLSACYVFLLTRLAYAAM